VYTSNVYLLLGTWNTLEDINTLIDVGQDPDIIKKIKNINTGVGKQQIDQVVLTHCHSDHSGLLPEIRKIFRPLVYAFSPINNLVDHILRGGEKLRIADRIFEVIHTPGHSNDSICLYCEEDKLLFAGDTSFVIRTKNESYEETFIHVLKELGNKDIRDIYPGHGDPIMGQGNNIIQNALRTVMYDLL